MIGPLRLCEYYKQALKVTKLLVVLVPATELMLLMKIVLWLVVVNIAAEQTRTHVVEPGRACLSPQAAAVEQQQLRPVELRSSRQRHPQQ